MKKLLGIVVLGLLLSGNAFAEKFKCFNKTGFVTKNYKFKEDIKLKDPENTPLIRVIFSPDKCNNFIVSMRGNPAPTLVSYKYSFL